jgi:hypothetical protein
MKRNCVCFAYFANGKFIGWYSDTFGTITKNEPKIYGYSEEQLETIKINFSAKVKRSKDGSDDFLSQVARMISPLNEKAGSMMTIHSLTEKAKLEEYQDVELRVVECPEYSGPNPDFDEKEYKERVAERHTKMKDFGVFETSGKERIEIIERFDDIFGKLELNNWVYPDCDKVREWASTEPTEFIDVIKPEYGNN